MFHGPQPFGRSGSALGVGLLATFLMALAVSAFVTPAVAFGQVFSYTGGEQSYVVPPGATQVRVVVVGAPGNGGSRLPEESGAVVSADLPIPAGQLVLYVEVGGDGIAAYPPVRAFNGGGASAGGGASDLRLMPLSQPGSINSRVIVAGGGGGGEYPGGNAGAGGMAYKEGSGGGAGTLAGGGAGGSPTPECPDSGSPGSLGQGGDGSNGAIDGGGGGGGYYGGGGGGASGCFGGYDDYGGGGGGGGSSYASPQAMNVAVGLDPVGTPQITITALTPSPTPTSAPPPPPHADCGAHRPPGVSTQLRIIGAEARRPLPRTEPPQPEVSDVPALDRAPHPLSVEHAREGESRGPEDTYGSVGRRAMCDRVPGQSPQTPLHPPDRATGDDHTPERRGREPAGVQWANRRPATGSGLLHTDRDPDRQRRYRRNPNRTVQVLSMTACSCRPSHLHV